VVQWKSRHEPAKRVTVFNNNGSAGRLDDHPDLGPSPASRVSLVTRDANNGSDYTTGSRTHPWLHAATRFAGFPQVLPMFSIFTGSTGSASSNPNTLE